MENILRLGASECKGIVKRNRRHVRHELCQLLELVGGRSDQRQLTLLRQHQQQVLVGQQDELAAAVSSALPLALAVLEVDAREYGAVEAKGVAVVNDEVVEGGLQPGRCPALLESPSAGFIERLDSFEGRSQLRTWLFGILHRKAMERRRASIIDDRMDQIDEVFESRFDAKGNWSRPPADLERLMLSNEIGKLIRGCMDGLPVNQREAFVLREVEGFDTGEICKILDVSVTNFGVLMHRARGKAA
jgi:RNA polymerase sigma factor (sigma-70 family)